MGTFRVEITAVGGHGCERIAKEGEEVKRCGQTNCPDCLAVSLGRILAAHGSNVEKVVVRHWPGTEGEVEDTTQLTGTWPTRTIRTKGHF